MNRFLLVDGHNLLFRMFYGMPDNFYTPIGNKFNAVYGFMSAMNKVLSLLRPTHAIVLFDSPDCGERRSLDEDYKANRPDFSDAEPNDCPFTQLPAIYAFLRDAGIPMHETHGCEADDVIASYALRCPDDLHAVIFSTDRDYWQLVSEKVSILDYHGMDSSLITPPTVIRKYNVRPDQFADFKCLIGDKSDNITGVPGVGPKRAAELLNRFGSLENILASVEEIERPAVRKALIESRERLELNNRLIRLSANADLPIEPEFLSFRDKIPSNMMLAAMNYADDYAEEGRKRN